MTEDINTFNKELNISYVDESMPKPDNGLILKHCFYSDALYLLIYVFLFCNPFFRKYFNSDLQNYYLICLGIYVLASPVIYLIFKPKTIHKSHSIEFFNYFIRIFKNIIILKSDYKEVLNGFIPSYQEKQAIMLVFIKVFFGTLMVGFLYNDLGTISNNINICSHIFYNTNTADAIINNSNFLYKFAITVLFTIDVLMFAIGYLTEACFLNNKIKNVDTNIAGVIFCLLCYPPFNIVASKFLGWNQSDNTLAFNDITSVFAWSLRIAGLFFLAIYASASVSLGTRASNLTNRGTVTKFPYNIVRHPAYISKNLFWFFTTIPILLVDFNSPSFNLESYLTFAGLIMLSYISWAAIYYFRAIFEERHLMQDPEYQAYAEKVKYRFIPFVI